jgi:hypothetical protein
MLRPENDKQKVFNECHLKIMTKSMLWCTLYMKSDKNIKQEYFYTDIACLGKRQTKGIIYLASVLDNIRCN